MTIKEKYKANIIAHWDFRTGSLSDQSGNGWNPTITGSPYFANKKGRTLRTVANGDGLTLGKVIGTSGTIANMTIIIAFTPNRFNATNRTVKKFTGSGSTAGSFLVDYQNTGVARFLVSTSGATFKIASTPASTVVVGKPIVLGGVFDGAAQTVNVFNDGLANTAVDFTEAVIPLYDYDLEFVQEATNSGLSDSSQAIIFDVALTNAEMAQLYEEIKQEAHYDKPDIRRLSNPARNLMTDGDMEAGDTSAFTSHNSATLSKETDTPYSGSNYLKVTYNGVASPGARVNNQVELNKLYRITGYAKSDGTWTPQINDFGGVLWEGTTSTDWQYFDFTKYWSNAALDFLLYHSGQTSGYTAWDDIKIQEIPNADDVYIADGAGWNVTLDNFTSGHLQNTGWEVVSGTWQVSDSTGANKQIDCIGSGRLAMTNNQYKGTWEFDLFHSATTESRVYFMASTKNDYTGTQQGYMFTIGSTERLVLHRINAGATTLFTSAIDYVAEDSWVSIKITKTAAGVFTSYFSLDGKLTWTEIVEESGNNPTGVDLTYTTSAYTVLDIDTGDAVRNFRFIPYIE
jgi:hypothetical protein